MFITANRKDIAKCVHFIECFEFDQIQWFLNTIEPLMVISRISVKPLQIANGFYSY